jgi:hypothetical protein
VIRLFRTRIRGLISYGATVADAVHQAGIYAGKILSGARQLICRS